MCVEEVCGGQRRLHVSGFDATSTMQPLPLFTLLAVVEAAVKVAWRNGNMRAETAGKVRDGVGKEEGLRISLWRKGQRISDKWTKGKMYRFETWQHVRTVKLVGVGRWPIGHYGQWACDSLFMFTLGRFYIINIWR